MGLGEPGPDVIGPRGMLWCPNRGELTSCDCKAAVVVGGRVVGSVVGGNGAGLDLTGGT